MKLLNFIIFVVFVISFSACENESSRREYVEVVIKPVQKQSRVLPSQQMTSPAMQNLVKDSMSDSAFTWIVPSGWNEEIGSGMRLATFYPQDDPNIQVTLTAFGGSMGGIEANVVRWLGQLNLSLDQSQLASFLNDAEKVGRIDEKNGLLFDFSKLIDGPEEMAMTVALFPLEQEMVFLKMMASQEKNQQYRSEFLTLANSLKRKTN